MKVKNVEDVIRDEGAFMGIAATQVTFAGCNLHCSFCNTKDALLTTAGVNYTVAQLTEIICAEHKANMVVLTGGEPCKQEELADLVDQLLVRKKYIIVDTNGTLEVPSGVQWISASPKPESNYRIDTLCRPSELKYVVTPEFDADKAIPDTIRDLYAGKIWLMPDTTDPKLMKALWYKAVDIVRKDSKLRVGVQLHTYMRED